MLMGIDHQWVGLVTCNGVSTNWFACGDNGPTVTHGMGCNCPDTSATLAFTAADSPIQSIMYLGLSYGVSSCFSGFSTYCAEATQNVLPPSTTPTAAPSATSPITSTAPQTSSTSLTTNSGGVRTVILTQITDAPTATTLSFNSSSTTNTGGLSSVDPSTLSNGGLQTQGKIGVGVGSGLGALGVGTLLWYCVSCIIRRHKQKSRLSSKEQVEANATHEAKGFVEQDKLGDDDPRSPTWSGPKSELLADKNPRSPTWSGSKSELPADDHEIRSPVPAYEPYRGLYKSSSTAEVEGSPKFGAQSGAVREGVYEMP